MARFLLGLWCLVTAASAAEKVSLGAGSYLAAPPAGAKRPPQTIYRTDRVKGPTPTTDWWSSLAAEPFSSNMFPHPLAVRCTAQGLQVWYPGTALVASAKSVVGPVRSDFVIGLVGIEAFADARLDGYGEWDVTAAFGAGAATLRTTFGHGWPWVDVRADGAPVVLRCRVAPQVWAREDRYVAFTIAGAHYVALAPVGSTWRSDGAELTAGSTEVRIGLLPERSPEQVQRFAALPLGPSSTWLDWSVDTATGQITTRFAGPALQALYPHQWAATAAATEPGYESVRGPLKLVAGEFTTSLRQPGLLPVIPVVDGRETERLTALLPAALTKIGKAPDTYWEGKNLGLLAELHGVARQIDPPFAERVLAELKARLEDWFTVDDRPDDRCFWYEPTWGALVGQRPSYGSDDQLNDHHFHYGYFLRAAAEVAFTDPTWAERWGPLVDLLARDIATPDPDDPLFPRLRCFDPYAGHSWASGFARFGDGNNQESVSEAIGAWFGLALWGAATGSNKWRDLGLWLYTQETTAAAEYWFDVHQRTLRQGYGQSMASLIWGGKLDYATWFSGKPEHIHGIILLPVQPGTLYLGQYPDAVTRNLDNLARSAGVQPGEWSDWHDIFVMTEALADPEAARRHLERDWEKLGAEKRPLALAWVSSLQRLGRVDPTASSAGPLGLTFVKDGRRTRLTVDARGRLTVAAP